MEMEKAVRRSAASEMTLAVTAQFDQIQWALLGPLMVVTQALTGVIGIWTPAPDITIREEEEGVAVEIDDLTAVGGVVVEEHRKMDHKDTSHSHNGVIPTSTPPVLRLRVVSFIHTIKSRTTEVPLGNGVTAHRR